MAVPLEEDPYGASPFPPPSYGYNDYRGMGGLDLGELLQQQQTQQQAQQFNLQYSEAASQASAQAEADAQQQAAYGQSQQQFVDWPTFQKMSTEQGIEPGRTYDGYLGALDWQLQQAGYSPEDAHYEVEQFQKLVARPAEDRGVWGNLVKSAQEGAASGTRAIRASTAGSTDPELLAQMAMEAAGAEMTAPRARFQEALGESSPDLTAMQVIERIAKAGVQEPQGMINFFVEQLAQSYPVLASSAVSGVAGSAAGPVGTVAGVAIGAGAGSTALDVGATMLEVLTQEANQRNIDPNDRQALIELLKIPEVKDKVITDGLKHGIPVGLMDGAIAALSFGVGASVARSVRAGRSLVAGGKAVGGLAADVGLSAAGEKLGQVAQGVDDPMAVGLEALGSLGPGAAGMVGGAAYNQARSIRRPGAPPVPPREEPTLSPSPTSVPEDEIAAGPGAVDPAEIMYQVERRIRGIQEIELTDVPGEEIELQPVEQLPKIQVTPGAMEEIELTDVPSEQIDLKPITTPPPPLDVDNLDSLQERMATRNIVATDEELNGALDLIAGAPAETKQAAIASVIEGLGTSTNPNADAFSLELLRIAHELAPDVPATPQQVKAALAQAAKELGTTPDQVMPAIAQAAAQEIADAITTTRASTVTQTAEAPIQTKRSLRRGEQVPATDLGSLATQLISGGPVQGQSGAQKIQGQPRRSLRAGGSTQGNVALPVGQRGVGRANQGGAGTISLPPKRASTDAPKRELRASRVTKAVEESDITELDFTDADAIEAEKMYEELYPGRDFKKDSDDITGLSALADNEEGLTFAQEKALSGNTDSVLQYLGSVMQLPLARLVANKIRSLNLQLPPITFDTKLKDGGTYNGAITRNTPNKIHHYIVINPNLASLETVLHEYVHAATARLLLEPVTDTQKATRRKLEALMEYAKAQLPDLDRRGTGYGFTNLYEFIAEAFTNPNFQRELARLKMPGKLHNIVRDAWNAFKQLILDLFGAVKMNSVLAETLLAGADTFSSTQYGPEGAARLKQEGATILNAIQQSQKAAAPSTAFVGVKNGARTWIAYAKGDTYTLYPATTQEPKGVAGKGVAGLSRDQVEQRIRAAGDEVLPPVADGRPARGTPKTSDTKLVGFAPNGDFQVAAYEQKDGSWTYYETTGDLRTDPNATVHKGLTKDQAQRYLSQKNVQPEAPVLNAVKPAGETPSGIGYNPANLPFRVEFANNEAALLNIDRAQRENNVPFHERIGGMAILRNSNVERKNNEVHEKYVVPVAREGARIAKQFNKSQDDIETVMQRLHRIERNENKIRQWQRGDAIEERIQDLQRGIEDAQAYLRNLSNPQYIGDIKTNLAPLMKQLSDDTIDRKAAYGMLSREAAENMKRAYDFYTPFQKGKQTKTGMFARGVSQEGDNTFARLQQQAYMVTAQGEQNAIRRYIGHLLKDAGGLYNKEKPNETVGYLAEDKVDVKWNEATNSLSEGPTSHMFDENAIVYYEDGKRYTMVINEPSLLEAMHPYKGVQRTNMLTAAVATWANVTRIVAIGKTAMSPMFSPFNLVRDVQTAHINLPPNVSHVELAKAQFDPRTYRDAFANVFKDSFGYKMSGEFKEARDAGAFLSMRSYFGDADVIANNVIAAFQPTAWQRAKKFGGFGRSTPGTGGSLFKFIVGWAQAHESSTRFAVYKAARASGLSKEEAAVAAKTSTVNFENRGNRNLSKAYMFAGAKIASADQMVETGKTKGTAKVAAFTGSMIGMGLLFSFLGYKYSEKDKDGKSTYLKIPDYKKDSMALAWNKAGGIPLGQEVVAPFYILGNALGDALWGGRSAASTASRMITGWVNSYWPGNVPQQDITGHKGRPGEFLLRALIPTNIMPFSDLTLNRNTWGNEIVRGQEDKRKRGIRGHDMGTGNESELAVNLAKGIYNGTGGIIDPAPQHLEYLNQYFNPTAEGTKFFRDLLGNREPRYEGDVVNPIERKFTGRATGFYDQDQFDELLSRATQAKYLVSPPEGSGKKAVPLSSLPSEEQVLVRSADMLQRIDKDIDSYFKNYKLMSKDQIQRMQELKTKRMLEGIRRYNEMRDRAPR